MFHFFRSAFVIESAEESDDGHAGGGEDEEAGDEENESYDSRFIDDNDEDFSLSPRPRLPTMHAPRGNRRRVEPTKKKAKQAGASKPAKEPTKKKKAMREDGGAGCAAESGEDDIEILGINEASMEAMQNWAKNYPKSLGPIPPYLLY
jgi:hypothetical protein